MKPNTEPIRRFRCEHFFLSNFQSAYFVYNGQVWRTAEHAFQAAKTDDAKEIESIMKCSLPSEAKAVGRTVTIRAGWEDVKEEIMFCILCCKFIQNNEHLYRLLKTRDRLLVEGDNKHDNEWGDCFCPKCKEVEGKNKLGKILMRIREDIVTKGKESVSWKIGTLQEDDINYIEEMIKCAWMPDPDEDVLPRIKKVVSGGQTGADRGGLIAAMDTGIDVGGWCPKGRKSEDGKIPDRFPLKETEVADYMERTRLNVDDADLTIVFAYGEPTGGSAKTVDYVKEQNKPVLVVDLKRRTIRQIKDALRKVLSKFHVDVVVNVAGSRESKSPGIEKRVSEVMSFLIG